MKKLTKKFKTAIAGLVLAAGIAATPTQAQSSASLEAIKSMETGKTYFRPTITYTLPGDVQGMTFHEFYQDKTHFGKTSLTKKITDEQALMLQAVYGTAPDFKAGIGISTKIPTPQGTFAKAYFIPLWMKEGGIDKDRSIVGYFASADLPLGMKIHSFGEIDISGKSPKWAYGEIGLEKQLTKDLSVSYQPALRGTGSVVPELEHRLDIKYRLPVSKKD